MALNHTKYERAGLLLAQTAALWRRTLNMALGEMELTAGRYLVLEALAGAGRGGVSQQAIANALGMDKMTVSQLVRDLVKEGSIERRRGPGRRNYEVRLTDRGRNDYQGARPLARHHIEEFWAAAAGELQPLVETLERVREPAVARLAEMSDIRRAPAALRKRRRR